MTYNECYEKFPPGSFVVLKDKKQDSIFWFQVSGYCQKVNGVYESEYFPSACSNKTPMFFDLNNFEILMTFENYQDAEKYISRI